MTRPRKFDLKFTPETIGHVAVIARKYHSLIQRRIDQQLTFSPETETRNRKPLEQPAPFGATWELRFGPDNRFRVFYEVDNDERIVWILAIGIKEGNRLIINGEEYEV